MHISLDSALGRQRRLNSVGENVLQIAPDAAAAYSLRSLTGGDPKVVRVRRASDNGERDFTSSDVTSGEMLRWVNAQAIKPLDIQALEADGRTGDFLIAKAAYSLRSLGTRQAKVQSNGDTDGSFFSFTGATGDTAALNGIQYDLISQYNGAGLYNSTPPSPEDSQMARNTDGSWSLFVAETKTYALSAIGNAQYPFDADWTGTELENATFSQQGVDKFVVQVRRSSDDALKSFTADEVTDGTLLAFVGTGGSDNGFVKTWYDQSVTNEAGDTATGNHATQATAASQPKIVNAGSLLTTGVTFDGGDSLSVSGDPVITASSSGTYSAFSVQTVATTSEAGYLYGNASSSNGSSLYAAASAFTLTNKNVATLDNLSRSSGQNLLSAVYNNGDAGLLVNGAGTMTDAGTYDFSAGSSDFIIGNSNGGTSAGTFLTGSINEIVIYNSNQTDNRTAIEANIGETYSISGIPAYDDEVDGFVETWYDQSGNNRPLIQTTASEQPLIVEAGVFQNGVKANKATSNDTMQNLQVSTDGTNADFGTDDWASGASSKLGAVYVGTVPTDSVALPVARAIIWGGGRGVGGYQFGGVSLQVVKAGTDGWRIMNERQGLSPSTMENITSLNTDADVVLYGTTDNREFTINVNGSGDTETESADLDVRSTVPLSLFGAYGSTAGAYYQRSSGGVCKECYLYAGDPVANIPALATSINSHYSIY